MKTARNQYFSLFCAILVGVDTLKQPESDRA